MGLFKTVLWVCFLLSVGLVTALPDAIFKYDFNYNESNSTYTPDSGVYGYTPTISGATLQTDGTYYFDGTNDYIQVTPAGVDLQGISYTLVTKIRTPGTGSCNVDGDITIQNWWLRMTTTGTCNLRATLKNAAGADVTVYDNGVNYENSIGGGGWYHVVVMYDSSNNRTTIWNNGQLSSNISMAGAGSDTTAIRIGGGGTAGTYFEGWIDRIALYNGTLTQQEILTDLNTPQDTIETFNLSLSEAWVLGYDVGANTHARYLSQGVVYNASNNAATANTTWHREKWEEASLSVVRGDSYLEEITSTTTGAINLYSYRMNQMRETIDYCYNEGDIKCIVNVVLAYTPTYYADNATDCSSNRNRCSPYNSTLLYNNVIKPYIDNVTNNGEYLDFVWFEVWNEPDLSIFWMPDAGNRNTNNTVWEKFVTGVWNPFYDGMKNDYGSNITIISPGYSDSRSAAGYNFARNFIYNASNVTWQYSRDESGNGYTYTENGGVLYNLSTQAYDFDGTNDYILVSKSANLSVEGAYGGWFYANGVHAATAYVMDDYRGTYLFFTTTSKYACQVGAKGSAIFEDASDTYGVWRHVLCVFNETGLYTYVNGVLQASTRLSNASVAYDAARVFTLGRRDTLTSGYFNGSVRDVRVWNRSLSESEVAVVYANGTVSSDLILHFPFNYTNRTSDRTSFHTYWNEGEGNPYVNKILPQYNTLREILTNNSVPVSHPIDVGEFNVYTANVQVNKTKLSEGIISHTLQKWLENHPGEQLILYQWSDDRHYDSGISFYSEWPNRFTMVTDPWQGSELQYAYNATKNLLSYLSVGSVLYDIVYSNAVNLTTARFWNATGNLYLSLSNLQASTKAYINSPLGLNVTGYKHPDGTVYTNHLPLNTYEGVTYEVLVDWPVNESRVGLYFTAEEVITGDSVDNFTVVFTDNLTPEGNLQLSRSTPNSSSWTTSTPPTEVFRGTQLYINRTTDYILLNNIYRHNASDSGDQIRIYSYGSDPSWSGTTSLINLDLISSVTCTPVLTSGIYSYDLEGCGGSINLTGGTNYYVLLSSGSAQPYTRASIDSSDYLVNYTEIRSGAYLSGSTFAGTATELFNIVGYDYETFPIVNTTPEWSPESLFIQNLTAGNYTVRFIKDGWYNKTFSIEYLGGNQTEVLTGVYRSLLNLTAKYALNDSFVQNFNFTLYNTDYSYEENFTSTSGVMLIPVVLGDYLYNTTDYFNSSDNFTISLYGQTNKTIYIYTEMTLALFFYNETTKNALSTDWNVEIISTPYATNYTFTGSESNTTVAVPSNYTIRYWYNPAVIREYYIDIAGNSYNEIKLYMIDENISDYYAPVVKNPYGGACEDLTIKLLRYYVEDNAYNIVEMAKTDSQGRALLRVQPNTVNYKMIFDGACGYFVSSPQRFTVATETYTIASSQSILTVWNDVQNSGAALVYNNVTNTFVSNWDGSTGNTIVEGCLKVDKWASGVRSNELNSCSETVAGSLIHTLSTTNATKYVATSTLKDAEGNTVYTTTLTIQLEKPYETFGLTGVFLSLLVVLAFVFLFGGSTETTVFAGLFAIALMGVFGIFYNEWGVLVGIVIIAAIIAYKVRG